VKDFARDQGRIGLVSPNACGLSEAEQLDGIVDANTLAQARVGHDLAEQVDQRAVIGHRAVQVHMRRVTVSDDTFRRLEHAARGNGERVAIGRSLGREPAGAADLDPDIALVEQTAQRRERGPVSAFHHGGASPWSMTTVASIPPLNSVLQLWRCLQHHRDLGCEILQLSGARGRRCALACGDCRRLLYMREGVGKLECECTYGQLSARAIAPATSHLHVTVRRDQASALDFNGAPFRIKLRTLMCLK
jgi:hypothetical protein